MTLFLSAALSSYLLAAVAGASVAAACLPEKPRRVFWAIAALSFVASMSAAGLAVHELP